MNQEIEQIKETIEDYMVVIKRLNERIEKLRLICEHQWGPKKDSPWLSRDEQICSECGKTRWKDKMVYVGSPYESSSSYLVPAKHTDGWYY